MTAHSLLGLFVMNAFLLIPGAGLLWAIRGWATWAEFVRLLGLAYMLGVASVGVVLSLELVFGLQLSLASVAATGGVIASAGLAAGRIVRRPLPRARGDHRARIGIVAALSGGLVILNLEALFRAGRLSGLYAWDAWAFWVPKAKAIYYFGGLDDQFFTQLPNPTYPPLVPVLEASSFHFMGGPDAVTLHLQFWFFLCGFVAAVLGLLAPRVPPLLLWPFVLLVLVAPRVVSRTLEPQADFLLDYFFALAALLVALWLVERRSWQLASAAVFLAGAMLTKREGLLFAACIIVAALAASWRDRRSMWPRLALAAAFAVGAAIPWRVWFTSHDLTGELPQNGLLAVFSNLDRVWPGLDSVLVTLVDFDLWLIVLPLAGVAICLAFMGGARTLPLYAALVYGSMVFGFSWVLWSFTELELPLVQDEGVNPVVRLVAALVVVSAGLVPLLLDAAWRGADPTDRSVE